MTSTLTKEEKDELIASSLNAKKFSYSPYSNFRVGCALLTTCGKVIEGCNVENVSYGLAICAERTAYVKAISEGYKQFKAIAVSTDVESNFVFPCGACRQFMSEFGDLVVITVRNDLKFEETTLGELLPRSFDDKALANGQENNKKE